MSILTTLSDKTAFLSILCFVPPQMQSNLPAMSSSFQDEWNKAVKKLQDLAAGK